MQTIMEKIDFYLKQRAGDAIGIEAIVFSKEDGILGMTARAEEYFRFINQYKSKEE